MTKAYMAYYGPWKEAGHYFFTETGRWLEREERNRIPWKEHDIDGVLQPGCRLEDGRPVCQGPRTEGHALLHHKAGWTALSFWDSSVDTRPGCNSTYVAEGVFTFEQMVELAKSRFAVRWNRMKFPVVTAGTP